ncbi:MAG: hypothetical protein M1824_001679 [Vezdaea acicularis]|nr:MAG: hypothetical protein M1824_001679 [Vezdaea acicularis]
MPLDELATELITQVFLHLPTLESVLALASTSHHFHAIYKGPKNLQILTQAISTQYGPLPDLIQLATHNATQRPHIPRNVPISRTLLTSLLRLGRVATEWVAIYPSAHWSTDYASRRLLTSAEEYKVRRAIYRIWLYSLAFHNARYPRESRLSRIIIQERAALVRNWSFGELTEIHDVLGMISSVIGGEICLSNGDVIRKAREGGDTGLIVFAPPPLPLSRDFIALDTFQAQFYSHRSCVPARKFDAAAEGWGDEVNHYYIVQDMAKLDPGQLLWLRDRVRERGKRAVREYVEGLGEWFDNNGETMVQTIQWVVGERGDEDEWTEGSGGIVGESAGAGRYVIKCVVG